MTKSEKVSTGKGDYYTTGYLLEYFKDNYILIAVDLSEQASNADPSAVKQIVFQGVVGGDNNTKIRLYTLHKNSKETILNSTKEQQKLCQ